MKIIKRKSDNVVYFFFDDSENVSLTESGLVADSLKAPFIKSEDFELVSFEYSGDIKRICKAVSHIAGELVVTDQVEYDREEVVEVAIPSVVPKLSALKALSRAGLLDQVEPAIAAIEDPQERIDAGLDWAHSMTVDRHWPLVQSLKVTMGLTEEQLDDLFILASTL